MSLQQSYMCMCAPPPTRLDDWQMGRQEISQIISELLVFPWHPFSRWSQRLQISHWKKRRKKAVYYVPRSRYHCAKHCSVFISESRFPGHSLCQRSVWPLPCDGEHWGIKRAHLSCNWSLTYRSAASLFPPLYLALSLWAWLCSLLAPDYPGLSRAVRLQSVARSGEAFTAFR